MKLDLNIPSVGLGVVGGVLLGLLPLKAWGLFAYSWEQLPWIGASALALGTMAALTWKAPPVEARLNSKQVRDRLHQQFPTVSPSNVDWLDVPPSATPQEWLKSVGNTRRGARSAFEEQVSAPVNKDIYRAILAALHSTKHGKDKRWGIDELARRMWAAHQSKGTFNLVDYLAALEKTYPRIDFEWPSLTGHKSAHYEVIHIIDALISAREKNGVIPASDFLWLRFVDRRLWYVIDNVGRQTYHIEALGVMAHYDAEKRAGKPFMRPNVETALSGLAQYLDYVGDETLQPPIAPATNGFKADQEFDLGLNPRYGD